MARQTVPRTRGAAKTPPPKPQASRKAAQPGQNTEEPRAQGKKRNRRRASPDGLLPYTPLRGAFTGKGKQKRSPVSTTGQSRRRGGRAHNPPPLTPTPTGS